MMKVNLFATKLEENHTYIMKNIVKRIATMGAAVMMMSSMAIGASAADSFSFLYFQHWICYVKSYYCWKCSSG